MQPAAGRRLESAGRTWTEDVVLGTKRSIPFWRAKRPPLALERALAPSRRSPAKAVALTARELAQARSRGRLAAAARKKARFEER
jgi:hypothetical protein